jgi:hypothetical protein
MRRKDEKMVKLRSLLTYGLIIGVLAVWLVWWQWDRLADLIGRSGSAQTEQTTDIQELSEPDSSPEALSVAEREWAELFGGPPSWPDDFSAPASCQDVEEQLARLCLHLDAGLENGGSCALLQQAAADLASHPPRLTSELKRLDSVLANIFHIFRVLRGERIDLMRQMLREEESLAEPAAMALYRWLISREGCARSGRTQIRLEPLYDYAGFFFQSVGGQAYLRRRAPAVEALASFYALLIIDRALEQNHNPHGIDPRAEIERTRQLLENRPFIFGDRYLEILDGMKMRWSEKELPT